VRLNSSLFESRQVCYTELGANEQGAPTYDVANAVAKSVASSSLVKTAMYGEGKSHPFTKQS
jgi:hypothetical protein